MTHVRRCIIYTDSPFSICLLDHYHVGERFWVMGFPDKVGFEELVDLLTDICISFRIESSALLNDRFMVQIYVEPVDNNRRINVEHIIIGPRKHVLEEVHEFPPKASRQLQSNLD